MLDCFPTRSDQGEAKPVEGVAWIDLIDPTEAEIELVQNSTGYRVPGRDALAEIQSSSRNFVEKDAVYLSTPLIAHAFSHGGALSPVGFVLGPKVLITVRFSKFKAFDVVKREVAGFSGLTANETFVRLLENIVDKGADLLEHVSSELDALSRSAFHAQVGKTGKLSTATQRLREALRTVGRMGDRLSQIRDVLLGIARIVGYVIETRCTDMGEGRRQRLNAVRADVASLNDYEEHLANKVQFLLDATLGFISIEQNDIVKVLTIASIAGIPPVFFAGVWGMNFKNIPELSWAYGYPFAWAVMILSAVVPLVWFKWRGWM